MPQPEDNLERPLAADFNELRHELMNPLATIRGHAHLLTRVIDRSAGIGVNERARLLRGLAAIDRAVSTAVEVLDLAESHLDSLPAEPDHDSKENTSP